MTSSVGGQGEPNLALPLATRTGKMELSFPLGIPQGKFIMLWYFIPSFISSWFINTREKNLANIQPS